VLFRSTWPSRDETYVSTVVVLVTSVVAAIYTGVFDALWSALTDFVYTV
jgi:preprotein translocase SecE subunit